MFQASMTGRPCSYPSVLTVAVPSLSTAPSCGARRIQAAPRARSTWPCATKIASWPSARTGRARLMTRSTRTRTSAAFSPGVSPAGTPSVQRSHGPCRWTLICGVVRPSYAP